MNFEQLGVDASLVDVLNHNNIFEPTPIQREAIPLIIENKSFAAKSPTGSGKTLAFLLPLLQKSEAKTLILVPTRDLVEQIGNIANMLSEISHQRVALIYGGVEYAPQIEVLESNPDLIIATVGRLQDLIEKGVQSLDNFTHFVLDEVDQMMDLGFRDSIIELSKLRTATSQTLAFSATITTDVEVIIKAIDPNITFIEAQTTDNNIKRIEQKAFFVAKNMMDSLLLHILRSEKPEQAIIFTRSRNMADRLVELLRENRLESEAIHSDRSQVARGHILNRFREKETTILIATDLLARGIDVESVTHVINYGLPQNIEQYIHRIGRTARAGRSGKALSLCVVEDRELLSSICKFLKHNISIDQSHPYMTIDVIRAFSVGSNTKQTKSKKRKRCR